MLNLSETTVWHVSGSIYIYKLQLVQALKTEQQEKVKECGMATWLIFSDEATYHLSGRVICYCFRVWSSQNECQVIEHEGTPRK
jgi:hypothetical protein